MGERRQISNTLFQFIQLQQAGMQAGLEGQLVSRPGLYKTVVDWLNVSLVDNPEAYLIDPMSEQAQQAAQMAAQSAQQQAQQQAQILALPEQIKAQSAQYKTDVETMFNYFKTILEATVQANTAETQGQVDVIRSASEAKAAQATAAGRANGAGTGNDGQRANGSGAKSGANGGSRSPGGNAN